MTTDNQNHIINTLNVKDSVTPEKEIRTRIDFLKDFTRQAGTKGFVLGISGGQDSMLAGKLAQIAVDELNAETTDNPYQFLAVRLPYGTQKDEDDAQKAINWINPTDARTINIKPTVDAFYYTYNIEQDDRTEKNLSDYAKGNVKARVRMLTQYAYASERNLLVVGTDHAAEAVSGFFTKFGDGGADILPLSGLNKRQGKELLKALDAPTHIFEKVPTADLLDRNQAQPDETELGVTYDMLDDYLEGKDVPADVAEKIEHRYQMTEHKRQQPVDPAAEWWK